MFHHQLLRLIWMAAGAALLVNAGIRPVAAGYRQGPTQAQASVAPQLAP